MTFQCGISGRLRQRDTAARVLRPAVILSILFFVQSTQAATSVYVFDPNLSTVTKTGGFAGVNIAFSVDGRFQLSVEGGTAVFEEVDATLTDEAGSVYLLSLDEVFNMTGLVGDPAGPIIFRGKTDDGTESDVYMELTYEDGLVYLTGSTTPPPNSADLFFYELDAVATRKYAAGTGEPNDPYQIHTAEEMNAIGAEPDDWDSHFKLMADIDLSGFKGTDYNIIGVDWDNPFTGLFDGNGHAISNFTYTSVDTNYIGLFGCVGLQSNKGEIRNLGLLGSVVDAGAGECVAALVGSMNDGTIINCYCENISVSGGDKVGGLLGDNGGTVKNCYASGSVSCSGDTWYGGVGGLVGFNGNTITDCYASCSVTGNVTAGGLLGMNSGHVITCYSTGSVSGGENIGGLVGLEWGGKVRDSFWNLETSGVSESGGGAGKTTAQMQTAGTFLDEGWDFVDESANGTDDIWSICEGMNYPRLVWQIPVGDFVCPDGITTDDYLFFLNHWLDDNCDLTNAFCSGTDLDLSGKVDQTDLEIFLESWLADIGN